MAIGKVNDGNKAATGTSVPGPKESGNLCGTMGRPELCKKAEDLPVCSSSDNPKFGECTGTLQVVVEKIDGEDVYVLRDAKEDDERLSLLRAILNKLSGQKKYAKMYETQLAKYDALLKSIRNRRSPTFNEMESIIGGAELLFNSQYKPMYSALKNYKGFGRSEILNDKGAYDFFIYKNYVSQIDIEIENLVFENTSKAGQGPDGRFYQSGITLTAKQMEELIKKMPLVGDDYRCTKCPDKKAANKWGQKGTYIFMQFTERLETLISSLEKLKGSDEADAKTPKDNVLKTFTKKQRLELLSLLKKIKALSDKRMEAMELQMKALEEQLKTSKESIENMKSMLNLQWAFLIFLALQSMATLYMILDQKGIKIFGNNALNRYTQELVDMAKKGQLDPMNYKIRMSEIRRAVGMLIMGKNPALIGPAGCGKSAIAEGIAIMINTGLIKELEGAQLFRLDPGAMVGGSKYRGEFEDRLNGIIKKVLKLVSSGKKAILFLDEMHLLLGLGKAEGTSGASELLKPYLARGDILVIGATTAAEFRELIKLNPALGRRFLPVWIRELTKAETIDALKKKAEKIGAAIGTKASKLKAATEVFPKIEIEDAALEKLLNMVEVTRYPKDTDDPRRISQLISKIKDVIRKGLYPSEYVLPGQADALLSDIVGQLRMEYSFRGEPQNATRLTASDVERLMPSMINEKLQEINEMAQLDYDNAGEETSEPKNKGTNNEDKKSRGKRSASKADTPPPRPPGPERGPFEGGEPGKSGTGTTMSLGTSDPTGTDGTGMRFRGEAPARQTHAGNRGRVVAVRAGENTAVIVHIGSDGRATPVVAVKHTTVDNARTARTKLLIASEALKQAEKTQRLEAKRAALKQAAEARRQAKARAYELKVKRAALKRAAEARRAAKAKAYERVKKLRQEAEAKRAANAEAEFKAAEAKAMGKFPSVVRILTRRFMIIKNERYRAIITDLANSESPLFHSTKKALRAITHNHTIGEGGKFALASFVAELLTSKVMSPAEAMAAFESGAIFGASGMVAAKGGGMANARLAKTVFARRYPTVAGGAVGALVQVSGMLLGLGADQAVKTGTVDIGELLKTVPMLMALSAKNQLIVSTIIKVLQSFTKRSLTVPTALISLGLFVGDLIILKKLSEADFKRNATRELNSALIEHATIAGRLKLEINKAAPDTSKVKELAQKLMEKEALVRHQALMASAIGVRTFQYIKDKDDFYQTLERAKANGFKPDSDRVVDRAINIESGYKSDMQYLQEAAARRKPVAISLKLTPEELVRHLEGGDHCLATTQTRNEQTPGFISSEQTGNKHSLKLVSSDGLQWSARTYNRNEAPTLSAVGASSAVGAALSAENTVQDNGPTSYWQDKYLSAIDHNRDDVPQQVEALLANVRSGLLAATMKMIRSQEGVAL